MLHSVILRHLNGLLQGRLPFNGCVPSPLSPLKRDSAGDMNRIFPYPTIKKLLSPLDPSQAWLVVLNFRLFVSFSACRKNIQYLPLVILQRLHLSP